MDVPAAQALLQTQLVQHAVQELGGGCGEPQPVLPGHEGDVLRCGEVLLQIERLHLGEPLDVHGGELRVGITAPQVDLAIPRQLLLHKAVDGRVPTMGLTQALVHHPHFRHTVRDQPLEHAGQNDDQSDVRVLIDVMLSVVELQQHMAVEEVKRVEDDDTVAGPVHDPFHLHLLVLLRFERAYQGIVDPWLSVGGVVQSTIRQTDGHGVVHRKTNGKVLQVLMSATATGTLLQHMHTGPYRCAQAQVSASTCGTGELREGLRQQGYKVAVLQHGQRALPIFQNEPIAMNIHLKLARVSFISRSIRKMLMVNEPIVAQIAPTDLYGGMRK